MVAIKTMSRAEIKGRLERTRFNLFLLCVIGLGRGVRMRIPRLYCYIIPLKPNKLNSG